MKKYFFYLASLLLIGFSGCKEDPEPEPEPVRTSTVIIHNEGVFPSGVGSISLYDRATTSVENNVFQKANTFPAGPVIQSILVDGDRTFIVVNGSGVVYAVNSDTYEIELKISNLISPRYMAKIAKDKYFISDWGINGVHVLNMKTGAITKTLDTGFGPENMLVADSMVFIANSGGFANGAIQKDSTIIVYHAYADTIIDTLLVGENPNSLALDKNNMLWVLSSGVTNFDDATLSTPGDLRRINIDSMRVEDTLTFVDNQPKPAKMVIDTDGEILYFLSNGFAGNILQHDVERTTLLETPYIAGNFYGLGYDLIEENIYASVANGAANGSVKRYDKDGTLMSQFEVGIIPGGFGFK